MIDMIENLKINFPDVYKKIKILITCGKGTYYHLTPKYIMDKVEFAMASLEEYRDEHGAEDDYPKMSDDLLLNTITQLMFTGNTRKEVSEVLAIDNVDDLLEYVNVKSSIALEIVKHRFSTGE